MPINFACPSCGMRFTVPKTSAGRQAVCEGGGSPITVPATENVYEDYGIAKVGYGLADPDESAVVPESASVFTRAARDVGERPRPISRKSLEKMNSVRTESGARVYGYRKILIGIPVAIVIAFVVVAVIVPEVAAIAALLLVMLGALMVLIGYGVAVSIAFSEDGLYGWFLLIFPLCMVYYIVRRWNAMWPWVAMMTVGAGLIIVAGWIAETAAADAEPDSAEASRPAPERLIPLITFRTLAEHTSRA